VSSRQKIPDAIAVAVLVANRHRCCICNIPHKHVEIHHTDGNNSNNDPSNLAVLCRDCHSRVTGDEGLGRRYSEEEVREYKRQWELECSQSRNEESDESEEEEDDDDDEEPVDSVYHSRLIRSGGHYHRVFEMKSGQELVVSITADGYINVSVCDLSDYHKFLDGEDFMEYEGDEDVRDCDLSLCASDDGTYVLLLTNAGDEDADTTIDAAVWESAEDED
jgi:hypothetical protein